MTGPGMDHWSTSQSQNRISRFRICPCAETYCTRSLVSSASKPNVDRDEFVSFFRVTLCFGYSVAVCEIFWMKHTPGFLAIVNDAKTRVKEWDFREVKKRLDAGEKFTL